MGLLSTILHPIEAAKSLFRKGDIPERTPKDYRAGIRLLGELIGKIETWLKDMKASRNFTQAKEAMITQLIKNSRKYFKKGDLKQVKTNLLSLSQYFKNQVNIDEALNLIESLLPEYEQRINIEKLKGKK